MMGGGGGRGMGLGRSGPTKDKNAERDPNDPRIIKGTKRKRGKPGTSHHGHYHGTHDRDQVESLKLLTKEDRNFILSYTKKFKFEILKCIFWTLLGTLSGIAPPLISKRIIDEALENKDKVLLNQLTLLMFVLYMWFFFSSYVRSRITTITAQNVIRSIREDVFKQFLDLSMDYFDDNKRGELMSVVLNDVNSLSRAVTTGIISLFTNIVTIIAIFFTMMSLDWILALVAYLLIPLILITIKKTMRKIRDGHLKIREKVAEIQANVEENMSGIKVAQSLAVEKRNIKKFESLTSKNVDLRVQATKNHAKMGVLVSINTYLIIALMIGISGFRYIHYNQPIGIFIVFLQLTPQLLGPIGNLSGISNTFLEAGASLIHIREYMEVPINVPASENPIPLPEDIQGEIMFDNVEFSYDENTHFNYSLHINPKEKIGLVGETGSGKTTLISLMTRLYDVKKGKITIDGIDLRDIDNKELRENLAIVSQDVFIFQDTIMNNIRFGNPDATDEEVMEAAKKAQSHEFILKMPEKYETLLGNQGAGLSGGQRQLIAYARMILSNPKIVILDEATSNIDSYTENIIKNNMRELFENSTLIVIAHRFATLQSVDRLVLIEDGKITDNGTHEELFEKNEYYRELYEKQYSKY